MERPREGDVVGAARAERFRAAERVDEPDPDGWLRLRLTATWPDEVPGRLLAVGPHLEVLEPVDVRDRVIALAERIVARYRDGTRVDAGR